ncbi:MAG: aldehyde dehydrogenase (NAD+) [Parasphingorhabdus sp.]|jgi:aldehyde dehydrogenase (NAD+)
MSLVQNALQKVTPLPNYMIIDGQRIGIDNREHIETRDPGSGTLLTSVPAGTSTDIDQAVEAARLALKGPWQKMSPKQRGDLLWKSGEAIRAKADELGLVETLDTGKPLKEAVINVHRTADYFCYYAGIADKLEGSSIPLGDNKVCFTERVPIGVTGHIVPWNVPISMVARGIAPALACGNTAVVKPAEDTPLTAILLAEILEQTGIPAGVVNIVTGYGNQAGQRLSEHPDVRHITFTGSVETGKSVMTAAATHIASVTLELGGKSPHVIMADANVDAIVPDILNGVYKNAGQICSAGTRLLIQRSMHDTLVSKLVEYSEKINVGHGLNNPDMGPLISPKQLARVSGFAERARSRGIKFAHGGQPAEVADFAGGNYFMPSIAENVSPEDELAQSEVFGPVLSIITFDDLDQAIEISNNTAYGLAAGIHTQNITQAMRFAKQVDAGQIFINGYHGSGDTVPFGGMKESGIGREKGLAGLDAYSETKAITITL